MSAAERRENVPVVLAMLVLAGVAFAMSQTIVAPALNAIQAAFGVSASTAAWVQTGLLLSASVATPLAGKLGDLYGRSRVFGIVLIIFGLGAIVSALAGSIGVLIGGRVLQGIGGGVFPLAISIIRERFPREKVAVGIGSVSATFGIGGGIGLPLSGVIVDNLDLSWLFWVGVVTIPVGLIAWRVIPSGGDRAEGSVDVIGAVLLALALVAVLLGVNQSRDWGWGSARVLGLLAGGGVLFVVWGFAETKVRSPLVSMRVFFERPVLLTNFATLLLGFSLFAGFLLAPQILELPARTGFGFGLSVTHAGLLMLPLALGTLIGGPLGGTLHSRFPGRGPSVSAMLIFAAGYVVLTLLHDETWQVGLAVGLTGLGGGMALSTLANLLVEAVEPADVGVSTGINSIMRTVGGALGSAITVAIVAAHPGPGGLPRETGYTTSFAIAAGLGLLGALALLAVRPRREAEPVWDDAQAAGTARERVADTPEPTAETPEPTVQTPQPAAGAAATNGHHPLPAVAAAAEDDSRASFEALIADERRRIDAEAETARRARHAELDTRVAAAAERFQRLDTDRRRLGTELTRHEDAAAEHAAEAQRIRMELYAVIGELSALTRAQHERAGRPG